MKKHSASTTQTCIEALRQAIDPARATGVSDTGLVAALSEVAIKTVTADEASAQMHLDALAAILLIRRHKAMLDPVVRMDGQDGAPPDPHHRAYGIPIQRLPEDRFPNATGYS